MRKLRTHYTASNTLQLSIPDRIMRIGAPLCDVLHFSPFSFGHWILLQRDNVPSPNRLPELLAMAQATMSPDGYRRADPLGTGKIGLHDIPDTPAG